MLKSSEYKELKWPSEIAEGDSDNDGSRRILHQARQAVNSFCLHFVNHMFVTDESNFFMKYIVEKL